MNYIRNNYAFLFYLLCTYLFGSIPFGLLICKIYKGIDIREFGSKNIGATNVSRIVGKYYGFLTFVMDGLKSLLPVYVASLFYDEFYVFIVLFAAVMGHIFSFWLKFKGGKGISSTIWGLGSFDYRICLIMLVTWYVVYKKTRISSLSALISISTALIISFFIVKDIRSFILFLILVCIIFWAHRKNIQRLITGEEFAFKKK